MKDNKKSKFDKKVDACIEYMTEVLRMHNLSMENIDKMYRIQLIAKEEYVRLNNHEFFILMREYQRVFKILEKLKKPHHETIFNCICLN